MLDERLFSAPFVLVGPDNRSAREAVNDLPTARRILESDRATVATIVGTLTGDSWAVDIDPLDVGADAEAGEAVAEAVARWCDQLGVPHVVRASGRPGGRHLVVVVAETLLAEFRDVVSRAAEHHGAPATVRRTLRLLGAPHRQGLDAPVLTCTLAGDDLPEPRARRRQPLNGLVPARRAKRRRRNDPASDSRSEGEFGDACAWARAGWDHRRAWAQANQPGTKAAEMGERAWRRWIWCVAVTIAAAEQGVPEVEAWRRFQQASPQRGRHLGLPGWRRYWHHAIAETGRARHRRTRTRRSTITRPTRTAEQQAADQAEQQLLSTALRQAAARAVAEAGRRPQFARSLDAVLDVLATHLVHRAGSLSVRTWAEHAQTDTKTVRRTRDFAAEHGIIHRAHAYAGGATDTDAWQPGPAAAQLIDQHRRETSPTRWYTTPAPPLGLATPANQRARHTRERRQWHLRCELAEHAQRTGERFAQSQHPAARVLRSLWFQRTWWNRLTPDQQKHRIRQCQNRLGAMHRTERRAWLTWLNHRSALSTAADRLIHHAEQPGDLNLLVNAPATVHIGQRAACWRGVSGGVGDESRLNVA